MKPFKGKNGPLIIAEIGGNHEGSFAYAKKLTKLAISTNVDAVKFQIYTGDTLVSKIEDKDRNLHFKKFELAKEQYLELAEMVKEAGMYFMASVWDSEALNWIDPYIPIYKIGSGDLTAYPLLKEIASLKKPIILSSGLATETEILETINFIQSVDSRYTSKNYLAVLQCTSMYPIPYSAVNLKVINKLQSLTGITVGYSDHSEGLKALQYAYAMGAEILEFHFTDSRDGKVFRDHKVSLTVKEVKSLIEELNLINDLKGNEVKKPEQIELDNGHLKSFRRAVYFNKDLKAGTVITSDDLVVLRPNHGIDARNYKNLIGKELKYSIRAFEKINPESIL